MCQILEYQSRCTDFERSVAGLKADSARSRGHFLGLAEAVAANYAEFHSDVRRMQEEFHADYGSLASALHQEHTSSVQSTHPCTALAHTRSYAVASGACASNIIFLFFSMGVLGEEKGQWVKKNQMLLVYIYYYGART